MRKSIATLFVFALAVFAVAPAFAAAPANADLGLEAFLHQIGDLETVAVEKASGRCELPPKQVDNECYCLSVYEPVCGCNGKTYSNSCLASCEIRFWTEGECGNPPATS